MATSAPMSTNNQYIKYTINITQNSQNVSANSSNVTVSVRVYRTNTGYTTYGTGTVYCKINGTTYSAAITSDQKITSSGITIFSRTVTINHNADGTKTLVTSAWINHSQFSSSEQSYSQILTTIPRASSMSLSATTVALGSSVTININRASSSFTHTLRYVFGNSSGTIATGVTTARMWAPPLNLATVIPNATRGSLMVYCDTYNGGVKIGTTSVSLTVTVPSSVVPTISAVTIGEYVSGLNAKFGAYVQGKSRLSVRVTAAGSQGSNITAYSANLDGSNYTGASFTTATLNTSGTRTLTITATDSRGRTVTVTRSITVVAYTNPVITLFRVQRANSNGTINPEGQYLSIEYAFNISSVNDRNDKTFKIEYKATGSASYTTLTTGNVYSANTTLVPTTVFNVDSSYDLRLIVGDYFRTITHDAEVSTAFTLIDFNDSGRGVAFGKVSESDIFDIDLPSEFRKPAGFNNGESPNGAINLTSGFNLNNATTLGFYVIPTNAIAGSLVNKPIASTATGYIEVYSCGTSGQILQRYTTASKENAETWQRVYYQNAWGLWHRIATHSIDYAFTPASTVSVSRGCLTRQGDEVCIYLRASISAAKTSGSTFALGTIPADARPGASVATVGIYSTLGVCHVWITSAGVVNVRFTEAYAANTGIEFNLSWNVASVWF